MRSTNKLEHKYRTSKLQKYYGTLDYIHPLRNVIEKILEYEKELHLTFTDFNKAFDPVEL